MTATESLNIPICGYLAAAGMKPEKVKAGAAWYASPFATEPGGNILALVMALNKTKTLGALLILLKPELSKPFIHYSESNF